MELSIEAESSEAIFEEATLALAELLPPAPEGEPVRHQVRVSASDLPALLAEWLEELVYLSETAAFTAERAERVELAGSTLEAVVAGRRSTPQTLVKGVTYHGLELERVGGSWRAHVVLDV